MKKLRAAVVGATGIAGQQALVSLADHPWFEVTVLAASARTAGKPYADAIRDKNGARHWWCTEESCRKRRSSIRDRSTSSSRSSRPTRRASSSPCTQRTYRS
jgi:aspartate-semialdehyde dehydrogenase